MAVILVQNIFILWGSFAKNHNTVSYIQGFAAEI
jgi:hypothetical protein